MQQVNATPMQYLCNTPQRYPHFQLKNEGERNACNGMLILFGAQILALPSYERKCSLDERAHLR